MLVFGPGAQVATPLAETPMLLDHVRNILKSAVRELHHEIVNLSRSPYGSSAVSSGNFSTEQKGISFVARVHSIEPKRGKHHGHLQRHLSDL